MPPVRCNILRYALIRVFLLTFVVSSGAQIQEGRLSAGLNISTYKFWGDFGSDMFGYGSEFNVRYDVAPIIGIQFASGIGTTSFRVTQYEIALNPDYYKGRNIGNLYEGTLTRIDSVNDIRLFHTELCAVFHILPSREFVPQAFFGIGLLNHYATNSTEHSPLPRDLGDRYSRWSVDFPVGIGFEYFLSENFSVNARGILRISTSDNLDDMSPVASSNDYFATVGGGVNFYIDGELDTDDDGVPNTEERRLGLDPASHDSDGDSLSDYEELRLYRTDPKKADSDGDGLFDGEEVTFASNPLKTDSDLDGLGDAEEFARKTNPNDADSDKDGLTDGDEVRRYDSNPTAVDTDDDGLKDADEVKAGTDPLNPDTDGDGLRDGVELKQTKTNALKTDTDSDGLSDSDETLKYATDPFTVDTDNDGLTDGEEIIRYKTNARMTDTDFDGWTDGEEVMRRCTNPANPDSDGDGTIDSKDSEPCGPGSCCGGNKTPMSVPKTEDPVKQPKPKRNFSIKFLKNSDTIDDADPETQRSLAELKDYLLNECEKARVTFEGHTSSEGNADRNRVLSDMRARNVKKIMIQQGVAPEKILGTVGMGSSMPMVVEPPPSLARKMSKAELEAVRKQNRRITVREDVGCD